MTFNYTEKFNAGKNIFFYGQKNLDGTAVAEFIPIAKRIGTPLKGGNTI
jgi:hypothetical protein